MVKREEASCKKRMATLKLLTDWPFIFIRVHHSRQKKVSCSLLPVMDLAAERVFTAVKALIQCTLTLHLIFAENHMDDLSGWIWYH